MRAPRTQVDVASVCLDRGVVLVKVTGELDLATRQPFEQRLAEAALSAPGGLIVDLRDITFMDAGSIRALLYASNILGDRELVLVVESPSLERLFRLAALDEAAVLERSLPLAAARLGVSRLPEAALASA